MTKHDLKELAAMGAELGAAKAENERLRGLLQQVVDCQAEHYGDGCGLHLSMITLAGRIKDALSQQPEPVRSPRTEDTASMDSDSAQEQFTAVDMATAAAQGFRDGQAAVEQAAAKDETEPVYQFQWREIGEGDWMACSHSWFRFCEASPEHDTRVVEVARPAQTEQQPSAAQQILDLIMEECRYWHGRDEARRGNFASLYAAAKELADNTAPIAQTAPQGKFRMGDLVKKSTGSEWVGRVVGWYSTNQTPEGYAVESEAHAGSVQIYPAKALELVPMAAKEA